MITEQQADDIAQSAFRLRTALVRNSLQNEASLLVASAMPAIVSHVCEKPAAGPEADGEIGYRDPPAGPCAATQAYGATGCT